MYAWLQHQVFFRCAALRARASSPQQRPLPPAPMQKEKWFFSTRRKAREMKTIFSGTVEQGLHDDIEHLHQLDDFLEKPLENFIFKTSLGARAPEIFKRHMFLTGKNQNLLVLNSDCRFQKHMMQVPCSQILVSIRVEFEKLFASQGVCSDSVGR